MNNAELEAAGRKFCVGEDLYGHSLDLLVERLAVLEAESRRVSLYVDKKRVELEKADDIFKKQ